MYSSYVKYQAIWRHQIYTIFEDLHIRVRLIPYISAERSQDGGMNHQPRQYRIFSPGNEEKVLSFYQSIKQTLWKKLQTYQVALPYWGIKYFFIVNTLQCFWVWKKSFFFHLAIQPCISISAFNTSIKSSFPSHSYLIFPLWGWTINQLNVQSFSLEKRKMCVSLLNAIILMELKKYQVTLPYRWIKFFFIFRALSFWVWSGSFFFHLHMQLMGKELSCSNL